MRFGLEYLFPDSPMMSVFEDGSTLTMYRDPHLTSAEIAKFSKHDAEAFLRLSAQAAAWLPMFVSTLYTPPMPLGASNALLDQSREGRELWRTIQMSSHDVLASYFEHDRVRAHFARVAGENLVSADEKATGVGVFVFVGFLEAYGFGVPVGGSGKLTEALVRCIESYGGAVMAEQEVNEVIVSQRSGRRRGHRGWRAPPGQRCGDRCDPSPQTLLLGRGSRSGGAHGRGEPRR